MADPNLLETRRSAHRVFLVREKRDRFNPFRHIPWDYPTTDTNDLELGIKKRERSQLKGP